MLLLIVTNMEIWIDVISFAFLELIGCVMLKSPEPVLDQQRKWKRIPQDCAPRKVDCLT